MTEAIHGKHVENAGLKKNLGAFFCKVLFRAFNMLTCILQTYLTITSLENISNSILPYVIIGLQTITDPFYPACQVYEDTSMQSQYLEQFSVFQAPLSSPLYR